MIVYTNLFKEIITNIVLLLNINNKIGTMSKISIEETIEEVIDKLIERSESFDQKNKELIKKDGVVFTDRTICTKIIEKIEPNINETICEPSVGKGSFVLNLLEYFRRKNHSIYEIIDFVENRLYCFDINESFINEAKFLIESYIKIFEPNYTLKTKNINCSDFLSNQQEYDLILGNPPYVRIQNIDEQYLKTLKYDLKSLKLGNIDLYYAFLEKAILTSKRFGFIIPNSFIKNKSGLFIREILFNNIEYIFDFGNEKVWNQISTYTCIVVCNNTSSCDSIKYENKKGIIDKNKNELSNDKWIFFDYEDGENNLSDYIHYQQNGIATLRDKIFKVDFSDGVLKKDGFEIEKEICSKIIKVTKSKKFEDYTWIIYPYDQNGKIIKEDVLSENYPNAYQYLLSQKNELSKRDKGKTSKYDAWYAYGRRQGLLRKTNGTKILLPLVFSKKNGIHFIKVPSDDNCLVLSGIMVDVINEDLDKFISVIKSEEFTNYCLIQNKIMSGTNNDDLWPTITTTTLSKFKHK